MSKCLHKITDTEGTEIEITRRIIRFFGENELMGCLFFNDDHELGMIVVDDIVLDELEKMIDWDLEPEDSNISKLKEQAEKDLEDKMQVHYRVY